MITHNDVTKIKTIEDLISLGKKNSLTLNNTNLYTNKDDINFPYQNIFREHYRSLIMRYCKKLQLSEKLCYHYKFKPKTFCLDLYKSTDMWHLLLWINNMTSIIEFDENRIKNLIIIHPDSLEILDKILEKEKVVLAENDKYKN